MKSRRAQHETAGFVLIVVVVTIIGLIFLTFLAMSRHEVPKSAEVSHLLQASMYYTTDCMVIGEYKNLEELIESCYYKQIGHRSEICLDNREVCDALELNLKDVIDKSLGVGSNSPNKAYKMNIFYEDLESEVPDEGIMDLENGEYNNCSYVIAGDHILLVGLTSPGVINVQLEVCKG